MPSPDLVEQPESPDTSDGKELLQILTTRLRQKDTTYNFHSLSKKFQLLDSDGNGQLSIEEFSKIFPRDLGWQRYKRE